MILILDNFDSFTYNLVDYFQQLGIEIQVKRNNTPPEEISTGHYSGIVLSPGPGTPEKAGYLMEVIKYFHHKLPMFGICLGQQALCQFFGGEITKAIMPMHGKISLIRHWDDPIFNTIPEYFKVVRYHSLVCTNLPDVLLVTSETEEKEIMSVRHRLLPVWGVQFHPEAALTEHGLKILENWVQVNNLSV